jgi:peptidylprolyl isomerase
MNQNFLKYVESGFYDGLTFHRVISDFMIQGGGLDKLLNEKKGAFPPVGNESDNGLSNKRRTIAMARTPDPNSATSQFYINVVDDVRRGLDGRAGSPTGYTVFGKVIAGMEVVDTIRNVETGTKLDPNQKPYENVPLEPVYIKSVKAIADNPGGDNEGEINGDEVAMTWSEPGGPVRGHFKLRLKIPASASLAANRTGGLPTSAAEAGNPLVRKPPVPAADEMTKTESGLRYQDLVVGKGEKPASGQTCIVHYTGWIWQNGQRSRKFDSSVDRGQPAEFPLGGVIQGWAEGVSNMKVGGKRLLLIPPSLAYGDRGAGGIIPPNATLLFEVELLDLKSATPLGQTAGGTGGLLTSAGEAGNPLVGKPNAVRNYG